jgi:hypothetical protein
MACTQALQRQTPGGVYAGDAQDGRADMIAFRPCTDLPLGIRAPSRPCRLRIERVCLGDQRAAAIAVYAAGADVDQTPGQTAARKCREKVAGAGVALALAGRRREMQYGIGQPGDAREARAVIQVARNRRNAKRAQCGAFGRVAHQRVHPVAPGQHRNRTQRDVAATRYQQSSHAGIMR